MPTARVSAHYRNGQRVRGYSQRRPQSRAAMLANAGTGSLVAAGGLTAAAMGLLDAVLTVTAYTLLALFGSLLGVRFYKRTHRRPWSKRRKRVSIKRRKPGSGPPARRGRAPWAGSAPWSHSGPTTVYKRRGNTNVWEKVG